MTRLTVLFSLFSCLALSGAELQSEQPQGRMEPPPPELEGVGIKERLNSQLPLDAQFIDHTSHTVTLGKYFQGKRPVLMTLVYYRCPMLCNLVANGMVEAMRQIELTAGKDYECLVISFDPAETPKLSEANRQRFIAAYERPEGAPGIHFLTGRHENIQRLAEAIGFTFKWSDTEKQYMHAAAIYTCTAEGRLSHYHYGVQFEPQQVRMSLLDAGRGKVGSFGDQILMFCYNYDPTAHKYSLSALRLVQAGSVLTLLLVGAFLGTCWVREARRRRTQADAEKSGRGDSGQAPSGTVQDA